LRPLVPADYPVIHEMAQTPGVGDLWRFRDHVPPLPAFIEGLWRGVLLQTVICAGPSSEVIGLVSAYNADFRSGTCELAIVQRPDVGFRGVALAGVGAFLGGLFANWPFRYVVLEVYGPSLGSFASALDRVGTRRGMLRADLCWRGELYDKHIFTIDRSWGERLGGMARRLVPKEDEVGQGTATQG
jgi:hypothetical protein